MSPKKKSEIEGCPQEDASGRGRRSAARRQARESMAAAAALWSGTEPLETRPSKPVESAEIRGMAVDAAPDAPQAPTSAQLRVRWERERFETLRRTPGAMAFYEEALARAAHKGALEAIAKANGLTEADVRCVWERFLENHRERVIRLAAGRRLETARCEAFDSDADAAKLQAPEADERENTNTQRENGADPEAVLKADAENEEDGMRREAEGKEDDVSDTDKEHVRTEGLDRQSRAHLQRVINEEIGREEYERCLQARRRLGEESRRAGKSRFAGFKNALVAVVAAAAAAACAWFVFQVPVPAGLVDGFGRLFSTQTIAVVDRTAARGVIADLARTESLSTVMAANDVFEELFASAAATVAARLNATVLDAKAVVATANAGSVDVTEAVKDEIGRLVRTSRLPQKTVDSIGVKAPLKPAPEAERGEAP